MINRKHLKAMLFAGFLGVMTLASTVPSMAATGWNKVDNQWVYYDSSGNLRKGWLGTSDGAYYYMDQSSGKMTTGWKRSTTSGIFSVLMELWWPAAGSQIRANFTIYMKMVRWSPDG